MKRFIYILGISFISAILCLFLIMRIWIASGIKERINIAEEQYPGKAEDALIGYLSDTSHSPRERSDVAIWTLGQIRSEKALPILKDLYKNDPAGNTCFGRHDSVLCQYEIHKAIVNIERNWLGAREKNLFGSWARLNK